MVGVIILSKLVCHMGKYTRGNVFGLQRHNQRENKNYSNENVDLEKSKFNYDLANQGNIKYLNKVDEIINKYRTNTDRSVRRDAVVFVDTIISSDKLFFDNLTEADTKKFFEESYKYLKEKVGSENIVSAMVHLDENCPHMHMSFVPINDDGSLSAKKKINRNFLRKIQEEFPQYLKNKGFDIERGMENSTKKHLEPLEFKKEQIKNDIAELQKLEKENMNKFKEVSNTSESLSKSEEHIKSVLGKINQIKAEKKLFSDKLTISEEDYGVLMKLAKTGEGKLIENIKLKSKFNTLNQKIEDLEHRLESKSLDDEILKAKVQSYDLLLNENKKLKKNFKRIEKAINNLDLVEKINKEIENMMSKEIKRTKNRGIER